MPFLACTWREIGKIRCAKSHVSTAIGGIDANENSASFGLTATSTAAAPTIIIPLWIAWTTPQPMK